MTTLNPGRLGDALRAGACGSHPLEAGTGLLIDCGSWLHRDDFTSRFITAGPSISDGVTLLASIDWETAVTALRAGELPASGGERRMLLLASSIAGGTLVSLNDALPGIDRRNASHVVGAVAHAAGLPDPYQETRNGQKGMKRLVQRSGCAHGCKGFRTRARIFRWRPYAARNDREIPAIPPWWEPGIHRSAAAPAALPGTPGGK